MTLTRQHCWSRLFYGFRGIYNVLNLLNGHIWAQTWSYSIPNQIPSERKKRLKIKQQTFTPPPHQPAFCVSQKYLFLMFSTAIMIPPGGFLIHRRHRVHCLSSETTLRWVWLKENQERSLIHLPGFVLRLRLNDNHKKCIQTIQSSIDLLICHEK